MNRFDYVTNKRVREVLLSAIIDKKDLEFAVDYSARCFMADENNTDIPSDVLEARDEALNNAFDSLFASDYKASRKFLKLFWSV
jgi:hypothetical protein